MTTFIYKRTVIDQITQFLPTNDIVVIHGARQVGKTSILIYLQDLLRSEKEQVFYIDLEDSRFVTFNGQGSR